MKIAMIGQKGYPARYGGVERHVAEISQRIVQAGHDVTIYNRAWYGDNINEMVGGITIKTLPTIRTKHLDAIVHTFLSTFHAIYKKVDVIHYHGVGPSLLSWIPRMFSNAKVVTTFHCIDRHHQKWNWFARRILHLGERAACICAHATIAVSRGLQQYCRNEYLQETTYIPNGVPVRNKGSVKEKLLEPFGLEKNKYILMVSRLVPHKGAHILIEAFQKLKKENFLNSNVQKLKLAIVGGSSYTDDYVRSLPMLASKSNDIVFTDYQSDKSLDTLFRGASFVVHPSMNEGLPITVLEAMSYGQPTLVSSIPEHLEVIKDTNMHFVENDVDSLHERMDALINIDEKNKISIGKYNKMYVTREYDWDTIVDNIVQLYETTLPQKKLSLQKTSTVV